MLHCRIQELRLEFFSRKAIHIRVGLVENRHCCSAGSNLALLPSLRQEFKRFQFAVGQRYAAMCTVLAMYMYRLMLNQVISLKTMIFKAKINTTHVALNIAVRPEIEEIQIIFRLIAR